MQEYNYLVKKQNKALSIFEKTKVKLLSIVDQINKEINKNSEQEQSSREAISEENAKIKERQDATVYLKSEIKKLEKTVGNMDNLLN